MERQASAVVNGSRQKPGYDPGPKFQDELREKLDQEVRELDGEVKDIPITFRKEVQDAIDYFTTDAREFMRRSLERSNKYAPMIRKIFRDRGLPTDLVYLALIETGYRVDAVSPAKAAGLWQFMKATARGYNLTINDWVDERLHPVKATEAAAAYLDYLHKKFDCWHLAVAAYNAGEGKIERAQKKYNVESFWEISAKGKYLALETRNYVPKFLAAILIAKDPARFGFDDITPELPEVYDEVEVPTPTDLSVIARLAGVSEEDIKALNPHLKRWCTPLNERNYTVAVPQGTSVAFYQRYAKLPVQDRMKVSVHQVRNGESLRSIASQYGLTASTLKVFNGLKSSRIKAGQKIKLPVDPVVYLAQQKKHDVMVAAKRKRLEALGSKVVYTVRAGDNPWLIAKNFDIHWKDIAAWNNIEDVTKIQPGQKLVLYLDKDSGSSTTAKLPASDTAPSSTSRTAAKSSDVKVDLKPEFYTVKPGDTISNIATRFNENARTIRELNGLENNIINVGQILRITPESKPVETAEVDPSPPPAEKKDLPPTGTTYKVQPNDTIWTIAQKFKIADKDLLLANGKKSNQIRPGEILKIPVKETADHSSPPQKVSYTVQTGDTVWKIAKQFNVDPDKLKSWNNMQSNSLRPGDVLTIIPEG